MVNTSSWRLQNNYQTTRIKKVRHSGDAYNLRASSRLVYTSYMVGPSQNHSREQKEAGIASKNAVTIAQEPDFLSHSMWTHTQNSFLPSERLFNTSIFEENRGKIKLSVKGETCWLVSPFCPVISFHPFINRETIPDSHWGYWTLLGLLSPERLLLTPTCPCSMPPGLPVCCIGPSSPCPLPHI